MELALSVGGEYSNKKQERWGDSVAGRIITEGLALSCRDGDHKVGDGARNGSPIQLDLKLSWSNVAGSDYETKDKDEVGASSSESLPAGAAGKYGGEGGIERGSSRCSDEEEGVMGSTRKKLRLSKEQSCYLEESFKEHPTLNPKQKLALAKQLNLRPRQVEVWFQNRRARTKLKQTEVDCEYLKRCCESLTEENRRLRKEVQDLKALKTPNHPFRLHVPPTTLNMCPSCDHTLVAATSPPPPPNHHRISSSTTTTAYNHLLKSRFCPP